MVLVSGCPDHACLLELLPRIVDWRALRRWVAVGVIDDGWHGGRGDKWMMCGTLWGRAVGALRFSEPIAQPSFTHVGRRWWWIVIDNDLWRRLFWKLARLFWQRIAELLLLHRWLHRAVWRNISNHRLKLRIHVNPTLIVLLTQGVGIVREVVVVQARREFRHEKTRSTELTFSWQRVEESQLAGVRSEAKIEPFAARLTEHPQRILQVHTEHLAVG